MGCSRQGCVVSLPHPCSHPWAPVNLGRGKGNKAPLHFRAHRSVHASHASTLWRQTISYLPSSTDAARLTFSKSSMDSVSRTCFCRAASSRRHSWTTLGKLGEASFWEDATVLRVSADAARDSGVASRLSRAPACPRYPGGCLCLTVTWDSPFTKVAEPIGYGLELPGAACATRRDQPA